MNSLAFARLKMYQVAADFLVENSTDTQLLPGFPELITKLQQNITLLKEKVKNQSGSQDGVSFAKKKEKEDLVNASLILSKKLTAFATMANDDMLLKNTKVSHSLLNLKQDHELAGYCMNLYETAFPLLPQLQPYSVSEPELNKLKQLCDDFFVMIPKPKEAKNTYKQSLLEIKQLFIETDQILHKMDVLMEILRLSSPGLVEMFKGARKIDNPGGKNLTVRGFVRDVDSKSGIAGAEIIFVHNNGNGNESSLPVIIKKSAIKGGYYVKSLDSGSYKATASKAGYQPQSLNVNITDGELTRIEFNLSPS